MLTRELVCQLDEAEVLVRGQQLAQSEHGYLALEIEKKATMNEFKDSMDAVRARIYRLSNAIRDKREARDVECVVQDDTGKLEHQVIRLDTGEVVEHYPFTEQERQNQLFEA